MKQINPKIIATKLFTFFFLWLFCVPLLHSQNLTIYVSPTGNDNAPGTQERPIQSLEKARDLIRLQKDKSSFNDSIQVIFSGGTYRLNSTFELLPEDSGTPEAPIIYKAADGQQPVFSGGIEVHGFKENENGLWEAKIPEVTYWNWTFDQLYVNDKRAQRAKSPNNGYFSLKDVKEEIWVKGTGRSPEKAQQIVTINDDASSELEALNELALSEVIMTVYHKWNITKRYIDKYDKTSGSVYTAGQGMKPWNQWNPGKRFILENYFQAIDTPGEWFLGKDGTLYYMPFPDEKIETSTFTIPVVEQLIKIQGDPENRSLVENVIFENLHFTHAAYYLPKEGFEPYQAAITIDAAIELNGASNIQFINCQLDHTGGYGIWLNQGVQNCEIKHCYLNDLGAGGIRIGETTLRDQELLQTHSNKVDNNIIQSGGFEFPTAVGVLIGQSANNEVTHNDIGDFRYTGVSVGWRWGYDYSPAKGNKILYNHIHHIGWGVLSDMSGVYTLGPSEGTEVSNNHIHHIFAYDYGGWGLYTDEGSSNIILENNLVHHTKTGGFHQHYGKENILRNNIFAFSKMYQLQATRVEDHKSFSFTNNIVIYDQGVLFQGPWTKIKAEIDHNIYWNLSGEVEFPGDNLKAWKKNGYDAHSFVIDPQFDNPEEGDFSFKNRKSYRKIDFIPFDYSMYGVYGSEAWKNKAQLPESLSTKFNKLFNQ